MNRVTQTALSLALTLVIPSSTEPTVPAPSSSNLDLPETSPSSVSFITINGVVLSAKCRTLRLNDFLKGLIHLGYRSPCTLPTWDSESMSTRSKKGLLRTATFTVNAMRQGF